MLIREKPIKIFDEATTGLDAKNKKLFLENILDNKYAYDYNASNDTLLFVDHSLEFLDKMSKVVILNNGEIILNDSYENIKTNSSFLQLQKFIINN
jgi:ABC-type transport system involved in cytochrome bd biosynthesis fused ATPase/permease subunit